MKKNIGTKDRLIRLGLGIVFLAIAIWVGGGWISWTLAVFAVLTFVAAATSFCPCYYFLGKNTYSTKK